MRRHAARLSQSHPHPGWAGRLLLLSVAAALLFSGGHAEPPPKPLDPPNPPVKTYTFICRSCATNRST